MCESNADVDAAAPCSRRSRRRVRRHGGPNISAGTEKNASNNIGLYPGVVVGNASFHSMKDNSNCESRFSFPRFNLKGRYRVIILV